jgi:hypothetical protein
MLQTGAAYPGAEPTDLFDHAARQLGPAFHPPTNTLTEADFQ